jgi:tetratricopeptide (TPR) repeat protein
VALPGGGEMLLADHVPRYAIGSGRFTQSYLVETDGFLVESPITWYSSVARWDMSPGYDRPDHNSFERAVGSRAAAQALRKAIEIRPADAELHHNLSLVYQRLGRPDQALEQRQMAEELNTLPAGTKSGPALNSR